MTTNFPTSLDALTNPTGASSLTSPDHAGQHTDANDAIEALQSKVGVNGSAVSGSLDFKVAASKVVTDKIDPAGATSNQVLKFNGTKFTPSTGASVTISDSPPSSPQAGDQWYESDTGRSFIYYDGVWVEIGAPSSVTVNANDLTGTTLAPNVVSSSLTSVGTLAGLNVTGTPTVPTAAVGTNTTQIATTAFVRSETTTRPNFLVYLSGSNGTVTSGSTIVYNAEVYDDLNNHSNGVFTVPSGHAGTYLFTVSGNAYNIGTGIWRIQIATTANDFFSSYSPAQGSADSFINMSCVVKLSVGQTAIVRFYTSQSGNYSAGLQYNSFSGVRIL